MKRRDWIERLSEFAPEPVRLVFEGGPLDGQEREVAPFDDEWGDPWPGRWWEPDLAPDLPNGRFQYVCDRATDGGFVMRPEVEPMEHLAKRLYVEDRIDLDGLIDLVASIHPPRTQPQEVFLA